MSVLKQIFSTGLTQGNFTSWLLKSMLLFGLSTPKGHFWPKNKMNPKATCDIGVFFAPATYRVWKRYSAYDPPTQVFSVIFTG